MLLFLYLRRVLSALQSSVGGIPPKISHRETPPRHKPAVSSSGSQVPSEGIGQAGFAALTETATPSSALSGKTAVGTSRAVENLRPIHSRAILSARSSKRHGPLVLCLTGGKA